MPKTFSTSYFSIQEPYDEFDWERVMDPTTTWTFIINGKEVRLSGKQLSNLLFPEEQ